VDNNEENWRVWKNPKGWSQNIEGQREFDMKEMIMRKISIRLGHNILRWGHSTKGTFSVKEAYDLKIVQELKGYLHLWKQIWHCKWWPKVAHFLWLTCKGRMM